MYYEPNFRILSDEDKTKQSGFFPPKAFSLYRHECFTGKYTTRKIHTKQNTGLMWRIFHILTSEDIISMISLISSLSLKLYLNSLVYDRNIFGCSSKVFGNLRKSSLIFGKFRKMFDNVRVTFGQILENFRKSSESGRKSSENRQKRRHQYVYIR